MSKQNAPKFVAITRDVIPKDGIKGKMSRFKAKIRKQLIKVGYEVETIRGVGLTVGDYAIVYKEEGDKCFAEFMPKTEVPQPTKSKKRKKAVEPLLQGKHPLYENVSLEDFGKEVVDLLPVTWVRQEPNVYRWLTIDLGLLYNNRKTPTDAVQFLTRLANHNLRGKEISYTTIKFDNQFLLGVGPA